MCVTFPTVPRTWMLSGARYLSPKNLILRKTLFTLKLEKFPLFPNKVELLASSMLSRNYFSCTFSSISSASDREASWYYRDGEYVGWLFRQFVVRLQNWWMNSSLPLLINCPHKNLEVRRTGKRLYYRGIVEPSTVLRNTPKRLLDAKFSKSLF